MAGVAECPIQQGTNEDTLDRPAGGSKVRASFEAVDLQFPFMLFVISESNLWIILFGNPISERQTRVVRATRVRDGILWVVAYPEIIRWIIFEAESESS
jgi:hypothetical protein